MAFTGKTEGITYAPGYFLANNEDCTRVTMNFKNTGDTGTVTTVGAAKYIKAGSIYPKSGETAIGLVYEDVDVTNGEAAGSVVTAGTVYEDRLPETVTESKDYLKNIIFIESAPKVTRPTYKEE